jgi:hypothetical protein
MRLRHRHALIVTSFATLLGGALACREATPRQHSIRQGTRSYQFAVSASQAPPHALDSVKYTIVVLDRKTRQPIEGGEGQIYAGHADGPRTWDGLVYGPEVGTYYGWLRFAIAGPWNVNVRFRRDSLSPLENTDWMQDVLDQTPYPAPAQRLRDTLPVRR